MMTKSLNTFSLISWRAGSGAEASLDGQVTQAGAELLLILVLSVVAGRVGVLAVGVVAIGILAVAIFAARTIGTCQRTGELIETPGAEDQANERELDAVAGISCSVTAGADCPEDTQTESGTHDGDCDDKTVEKRLPEAIHNGVPQLTERTKVRSYQPKDMG